MDDIPVRWGILGAGRISRVAVGPALDAADPCQVVAVGARDRDRAAALAPVARAYGGYEEVIADPDVEVVYIALPNDAHVPWATEALRAGKHVLCEKPLGMTAAEVEAAYAAADRAGLLLVEASWYRWHPRTRHAEQLVAGGALGDVTAVDAGFTFDGVPPTDYRMDPAKGGGAAYDVGCYALSAVGWATGWADTTVTAADARRASTGVDMMLAATVHAGGVTGRVRAAFDEPERQWIEVAGRDAALRFGKPAFTAWTPHATTLDIERTGEAITSVPFPACNPYQLMVEAVAGAVRGGDDWLVPAAETLATARALDAVLAAAG